MDNITCFSSLSLNQGLSMLTIRAHWINIYYSDLYIGLKGPLAGVMGEKARGLTVAIDKTLMRCKQQIHATNQMHCKVVNYSQALVKVWQ